MLTLRLWGLELLRELCDLRREFSRKVTSSVKVDSVAERLMVKHVYKSQRRSRNPPTEPKTMPTIVPGDGELFCSPYVVGIMLGSLIVVCRDVRRVKIFANFGGEGSLEFLGWRNVEIDFKSVVVLKVNEAECQVSLDIELGKSRGSRIGAMFDNKIYERRYARGCRKTPF